MKKYLPLLIILIVVVTGVVLYRNNPLQGQVLRDQSVTQEDDIPLLVEDCRKMSEKQANDCLKKVALQEKKPELCDEISKMVDKRKCQREVQLAQ